MDNFRKKNYKIGNANNGKFETNSNIIITKEENKNSFAGNTDIKKNQNNNMEINSIVTINIKTIDNNENINSNSKKNKDNNDIIGNSENIINKRNSNKNIKEVININEPLKVENINNKTNKSITPSLVIESKQFTNKVNSVNNNIYIKERKIINKNSQIDESSKVVNVGSAKKIKINKIKKIIKIPNIRIQNNNNNKININKILMSKPEIMLKDIIIYSNNRIDTKRTNRNYKYKRK
ncbi:hypothetical protein H8356DRAFT_1728729 [Neocallimastix lanati (nom. inval.)]|nr:hypothetical protein H8356DRAFT_1728729 [Neocallimastix sp. JGI-2020a]